MQYETGEFLTSFCLNFLKTLKIILLLPRDMLTFFSFIVTVWSQNYCGRTKLCVVTLLLTQYLVLEAMRFQNFKLFVIYLGLPPILSSHIEEYSYSQFGVKNSYQMHQFVHLKYRKVASRSTCYYSENQIFYSLE